jgi:cell division protein FtsI (penicillin-binding protein 3)
MNDKKKFRRFRIFILLTAVFIAFIIGKYASIMIMDNTGSTTGFSQITKVERGPILDRNGRILALQTQLMTVSVWTPYVEDPKATANYLSTVIGMTQEEIIKIIEDSPGFAFIKRKVSPTESSSVQKLLNEGLLPGISLSPEYARNYPEKNIASHIIGYTGMDNLGLDGIEYTFDEYLSPKSKKNQDETVYGNQIFLTIDLILQYALNELAEAALKKHDADSVMILTVDAKNGDILAYISLPDFDPNNFEVYDGLSRRNNPLAFMYEPGSAFKIFTLSTFLQNEGISESDTFYCPGYYEGYLKDDKLYKINCLGVHGNVNVEKIIKYSCNSGAAYASESIDKKSFYQGLKLFGFGEQTGIQLNGEEWGVLRKPARWSNRSRSTIAIGQEISVTSIQMASAATVFSNEGILLKPHIIKKIVSPDGNILQEFERETVRPVLSPEVARSVLYSMEASTDSNGTAWRAKVDGIRISAKTGTAQMVDPETGKYSEDAFVASCISIFPTDDPQIILYAVIVNSKGESHFGGRIAAPLIKECIEFIVPHMAIPFEEDDIFALPDKVLEKTPSLPVIKDTLPSFLGLGKKTLLPLLLRDDINVFIHGNGWVSKQHPEPGTPMSSGMDIILELE